MIVALGFDVGICHQEHGKDDGDDIPSWEDQAEEREKKFSK